MNKFIIFVLGAGIGSLVTWKVLDKKLDRKYSELAQKEIDEVKEVLHKKYGITNTKQEEKQAEPAVETDEDIANRIIDEQGYLSKEENEGAGLKHSDIYVISPDEFSEYSDYKTEELTYYDDDVLVNEDDEVIQDVESLIGPKALKTFGEYEDDAVFVRNDKLKTDYQILLDPRRYVDVLMQNPVRN